MKKLLEDLSELMSEKEALAQRCQELDLQVNMELMHNMHMFISLLYGDKVFHKVFSFLFLSECLIS